MNGYSDHIVARGITAHTPRADIDAAAQRVMMNHALSLRARGLFTLLAEMGGEPHNPFAELFEPAEAIHSAIEELVVAGLVIRV